MPLPIPGTNLGRYRVIEQIGLGGMATVYKAYQPNMERYVALKVLPDHYAQDPQFVARFIREARTIAKLEHRNILPVHDFGEENGTTFLVMRYLDGGTLKDLMRHGSLSIHDTVEIMTQTCSALDYAHRHGIIHRDVKPANIMVDSEGHAYLTDFGIAKVLEASESLTQTGAAIGTPEYMAPEQGLGQKVDARTDIYALGIIIYQMVVGRTPFQADTPMAVALAHIHTPLPMPSDVNPKVPEEIEQVILKALAKDPDDRYQTAADLAKALKKASHTAKTIQAAVPNVVDLPTLIGRTKASRPKAAPIPPAPPPTTPPPEGLAVTKVQEPEPPPPPAVQTAPAATTPPPPAPPPPSDPTIEAKPATPFPAEETIQAKQATPSPAEPTIEAKSPAPPEKRKFPLGYVLGGLGVLALIVIIGLGAAALGGVFDGDDDEPVGEPPPDGQPVGEPPSNGQPVDEPPDRPPVGEELGSGYDNFDDPDFDGSFDAERWEFSPWSDVFCEFVQQDGVLVVQNPDTPEGTGCGFTMAQPLEVPGRDLGRMQAEMLIDGGSGEGALGSYLSFSSWTDERGLSVECGIARWEEDMPYITMDVLFYSDPNGDGELVYEVEHPIEYDEWYTVALQVMPRMGVVCLVNDEPIGAFVPPIANELSEAPFTRELGSWYDAHTTTPVMFDNFYLLDPLPVDPGLVGGGSGEPGQPPDGEAGRLYDDFDSPEFDGALNEELWEFIVYEPPGCEIFQNDGMLSVVNEPVANRVIACELFMRHPPEVPGGEIHAIEADMQLQSDHNGQPLGSILRMFADFRDGPWMAQCGIDAGEFGIYITFGVFDYRFGEDPLKFTSIPIDYDEWHTVTLNIYPETMTAACLVDGELLGTYTPENADELREATFRRQLGNWRDRGAGTFNLDNFTVFPALPIVDEPSAGLPPGEPMMYDDFEDTGFDSGINEDAWEFVVWDGFAGCEIFQHDGMLTVANEPLSEQSTCNLFANRRREMPGHDLPSLQAPMQLLSDHNGPGLTSFFSYNAFLEENQFWYVNCGIAASPLQVRFEIHEGFWNNENDHDDVTIYFSNIPIEYDAWYDIGLYLDHESMTFTCVADGQVVGQYTPENANELRRVSFEQRFTNWRDAGTIGTINIEEILIFPP